MRSYFLEALENGGHLDEDQRGRHPKVKWLLDNPVLRKQFEDYVIKNGNKKGEKNMSSQDLLKFVNTQIFKVNPLVETNTLTVHFFSPQFCSGRGAGCALDEGRK